MNTYFKNLSPGGLIHSVRLPSYKQMAGGLQKRQDKNMKTDLSELKQENLITKFVSYDVPVEIYLDNSEYTEEEARTLQADFILTLLGIEHRRAC